MSEELENEYEVEARESGCHDLRDAPVVGIDADVQGDEMQYTDDTREEEYYIYVTYETSYEDREADLSPQAWLSASPDDLKMLEPAYDDV